MKKKTFPAIEFLSLTVSIVLLATTFFVIYLIMPVDHDNVWKEVEIPKGVSYAEGIDILMKGGVVNNRLPFVVLAKLTMTEKSLYAGFYNFNTSMSPLEIFNRLKNGMIVEYTITIPEGTSLKGIKAKLKKVGLIDDESWQLVRDREFLSSLNVDAPSLEGYIYPDTYYFAKGADPRNIFGIMVHRMREKFDQPLRARAAELGLTENMVLTLASIIEKEAIYDSEKPVISAVYHNRLKKKMRLQADPTVLYGVKKRWKRIRYRDLRRPTPYNTYVIKGLPPGPIASPAIEAIKAALYYKDVDYLYFVSMNNGRHHFSTTGEEHMKAVVAFQRNGREFKKRGRKKEN